jgi:hypothetical protein
MPNASDGPTVMRAVTDLVRARLDREDLMGALRFRHDPGQARHAFDTLLLETGWIAKLFTIGLGEDACLTLNPGGRKLLPECDPGHYEVIVTRHYVSSGTVVLWGTQSAHPAT